MTKSSPHTNLLVPIAVDALAVGTAGKNAQHQKSVAWFNAVPDFNNRYGQYDLLGPQQYPGQSQMWDFDAPGCPLETGIHLRWALPDALTHARVGSGSSSSSADNDSGYLPVPNRWLVVRMTAASAETPHVVAPEIAAWLIQSDHLNDDQPSSPSAAAQWPVFPGTTAKDLKPQDAVRFVGRALPLGQTSGGGTSSSALGTPLTALGWGDSGFAALYQLSHGVFGFHDDLHSFDSAPDVALTYVVLGWFHDPKDDPLSGVTDAAAWQQRMAEYRWTWPGAQASGSTPASDSYPTATLCQGSVERIRWQGAEADYDIDVVPSVDDVDIAVGTTALEALAALIAAKVHEEYPTLHRTDIEDLLIAFQQDQLTDGDSSAGAVNARHQDGFGTKAGGRHWEIRAKDSTEQGTGLPGQAPAAVPLPGQLGSLLTELNSLQSQYDAGTRVLETLRQRYFMTWFKQTEAFTTPSPNPLVALEATITKQQSALADLDAQINVGSQSVIAVLTKELASLLPDYELRDVPAPRFWEQHDPVVLVSGAGRALQHGHDGRHDTDGGNLLCRLSGDTLTALTVMPEGVNTLTFETSDLQVELPEDNGEIPTHLKADIGDLLLEAALLDPDQAEALASLRSGSFPPDMLSEVESSLSETQESVASNGPARPAGSIFTGVKPSPIGVTLWLTHSGQPGNPWIPLVMQWRMGWQAAYDPTDGVQDALNGWEFDGTDYKAERSSGSSGNSTDSISGVTLLTPSPVWHLARRLRDFVDEQTAGGSTEPDLTTLAKIVGQLEDIDILAQATGGFHQHLAMQRSGLQFPPIDADLKTYMYGLAATAGSPSLPLDKFLDGSYALGPLLTQSGGHFYPLRAGQSTLEKLAIVDAFGQVLNIEAPAPILGPGLRSGDQNSSSAAMELPPRLMQGARLNFRWMAAEAPGGESNSDPATSPVMGWIWVNDLDRSLMLATARGQILGKVRATADDTGVVWVPDPVTVSPTGSAASTSPSSLQLQSLGLEPFVTALKGLTGTEFTDFIDYISETQDQIVPPGSQATSNATLLMGAPIALARASLSLELDGLPIFDQSSDTGQAFDDRGLTEIPFNVALGDLQCPGDGLYGYFLGESPVDYGTFYTAFGEAGPVSTTDGFVTVAPLDPTPITLTAGPEGRAGPATQAILLLDPRCEVKAQTGILPAKAIRLPVQDIGALLRAHEIFFQVAPVLSSAGDFAMPRPSQEYGSWSWLEQIGGYAETGAGSSAAGSQGAGSQGAGSQGAVSPADWSSQWTERTGFAQRTGISGQPAYPLDLIDGWLRLRTPASAAAAILSFDVVGGTYRVPSGTPFALAWSALVPDGYSLALGIGTEPSSSTSSTNDLPSVATSWPCRVSDDTEFSLALHDEKGDVVATKTLIVTVGSSP